MAEKRFQWNKGDKIEGLIYCLSNFKVQMEYEKSRHARLNSKRLSEKQKTGFVSSQSSL